MLIERSPGRFDVQRGGCSYSTEAELRISFNPKTRLALIQFWYQEKIVGEQQVKAEDLTKVHF